MRRLRAVLRARPTPRRLAGGLRRTDAPLYLRYIPPVSPLYLQADYGALTHPNLQIDNGFYWRDASGALQAGLLDWYNCGEMPFAAVLQGCLSGMEPHALAEHEEGLMPREMWGDMGRYGEI